MKKVVIASVLKPIDEVRMYKRISLSLLKTNKYELNIIGIRSNTSIPKTPHLNTHTIVNSRRNLFLRLIAQCQTLLYLITIRPSILIVTSGELIPLCWLIGQFQSIKLVYDVQEDYAKNITYQRVYSGLLKNLLIWLSVKNQKIANHTIDRFWLAERCYATDMNILKPYDIIENKFAHHDKIITSKYSAELRVVFTGTISEYTGIFDAITVFNILYKHSSNVRLTIAGYCPQKEVYKKVINIVNKNPNIHLIGGNQFVSHDQIVETIATSDLALVTTEINPTSQDRIPSKLYEYAYLGIPFLTDQNAKWTDQFGDCKFAIPTDYSSIDPSEIISTCDYINNNPPESRQLQYSWEANEQLVWKSINQLIQ